MARGGSGEGGAGAVLALFRGGHARTRGDVVRLTGLARATVSQRLEVLVGAGLLRAVGEGASTGGRPPVRGPPSTRRRGSSWWLASGASETRVVVADLAGETLAERTHAIDVEAGPHAVLDLIRAEHAVLLADHSAARGRARIGSLPGPVEFATGRVVSPPSMPAWDRFDIPGYMAHRPEVPVLVDNDVNAMAFGSSGHAGRGTRTC